jgi:hypothetical protein
MSETPTTAADLKAGATILIPAGVDLARPRQPYRLLLSTDASTSKDRSIAYVSGTKQRLDGTTTRRKKTTIGAVIRVAEVQVVPAAAPEPVTFHGSGATYMRRFSRWQGVVTKMVGHRLNGEIFACPHQHPTRKRAARCSLAAGIRWTQAGEPGSWEPTLRDAIHDHQDLHHPGRFRDCQQGPCVVALAISDCHHIFTVRVRTHPDARESSLSQTHRYEGVATSRARNLSTHPLKELRPFYTAVYRGDLAYPVAVFQDGMRLKGAALEAALTTPFTHRRQIALAG